MRRRRSEVVESRNAADDTWRGNRVTIQVLRVRVRVRVRCLGLGLGVRVKVRVRGLGLGLGVRVRVRVSCFLSLRRPILITIFVQ
jgi:hypothetical protein